MPPPPFYPPSGQTTTFSQQPSSSGTDWRGYANRVLSDEFLRENPNFQQAVADPLRRESERTYADERQRLNQAAGGAGRFGGDVWQSLTGRNFELSDRNLNESLSGALYQNYANERQLQQAAAGLGQGYDTAYDTSRLAADAQRAAASSSANAGIRQAEINAQLQRDLLAEQLGFNREELGQQFDLGLLGMSTEDDWRRWQLQQQLGLQAATTAGQQGLAWADLQQQGGLSALQLMAQLGLGAGDQQLAALGQVPGLEQAGYAGYGMAGNLFSQLASLQQQNAGQNYQSQLAQWQYGHDNQQSALANWLSVVLPIAGAGGTSMGTGTASGVPTNPLAAGLGQGLAGLLQAGQLFGGGGGAGAAGAASFTPNLTGGYGTGGLQLPFGGGSSTAGAPTYNPTTGQWETSNPNNFLPSDNPWWGWQGGVTPPGQESEIGPQPGNTGFLPPPGG